MDVEEKRPKCESYLLNLSSVVRPKVTVTYQSRRKTEDNDKVPSPSSDSRAGNEATLRDSATQPNNGLLVKGKLPISPPNSERIDPKLGCRPLTSYFAKVEVPDNVRGIKRTASDAAVSNAKTVFGDSGTGVETEERSMLSSNSKRRCISPSTTLDPGKASATSASNSTPQLSSGNKKYEQLHLDLGQKNVGSVTCKACGMEYALGKQEDEALHDRYHRTAVGGIDWPGYKTETVVQTFPHENDSKIVVVTAGSNPYERRKVREVLSMVNRELGAVELSDAEVDRCKWPNPSNAHSVLYRREVVMLKTREGCHLSGRKEPSHITAEFGFQRGGGELKSEPKCLMLSDKGTFAFSQPTQAGKALAEHYTGRQDFLIYDDAHGASEAQTG
ncbi:Establishment of cohesion 1 [Borealophlyctis nickersoniae]|nr:Establishment of cohesion 1 [Borealophlyctis nickersoniae]